MKGEACSTCLMLPRWHHAQRLVAVLYRLRPGLRGHDVRRVLRRSRQAGRLRRGGDRSCKVFAGTEVRRHRREAAAVVALDAERTHEEVLGLG